MAQVTFYNNTFGKESVDVDLNGILKAIRGQKWGDKVSEYRKMIQNGKTEISEQFKKTQMPGLTVSGVFPNERKANKIGEHSGLIAMDFDNVSLDVRDELYADDYTYAGFVSVGGAGICIIVRIEPSKHIDAFRALEHYYYTKYNLQVDQSCKDVSRLRYVSSDPEMAVNPDAKQFKNYLPKPKGRKPKIKPVASTDDDIEMVLKQIESKKVDLTSNYDDWVQIGMSIAGKYGQSQQGINAFQRVSQFHSDYDPEKTERKYKSFGHPRSNIGIATFFYHAKNAGLEIKSPETRVIETVAKYAKKGRRTIDDAVRQLEKIDNIKPEKSQELVKAVFSGEVEPSSEEDDVVFEVEEFLRRECNVRYNEITLKYEIDKHPMTDRDFNSLYLNCKKVVPKVTKDLFISCIESDRTVTYNPVHEFFDKHKSNKPEGLIERLANSINTRTGTKHSGDFPDFCYYFLRKWMIGSVAMWYKHHSPLMFVLAGDIQNTGKTHFFRYLLPNELQMYFGEAELSGDKDENLLMCNKLIIMNDEMSNKSKRDITMVKKLCSAQWFNLRKPYGKLSEDFRRLAALAGTSNSLELLNDPTGNRRIIPVEVISINHDEYNAIDKKELWLEAYHAYKAGEDYNLSNQDIKRLSDSTLEFEEASLEGELVMKYFRTPIDPNHCQMLTSSEIKAFIEVRTNQRLNQRKLGMEMKRLGYEQRVVKDEGKSKRVYLLSERTGAQTYNKVEDANDESEYDKAPF